jgi:hypothetical protein
VNSNPATIMTDPEFADRTYIEPITPECVEKIMNFPGSAAGTGLLPEYEIDFTVLDEPPIVVVESGQIAPVRLLIDSDLLVDTYVSLFDCRESGIPCGGVFGAPPPCLASFDQGVEFAELAFPAFSFP